MVGIDLVSIKRIERFYEKYGQKAYKRFLRPQEIELVKSPQNAAGFWAAKEATSKALGCGIGEICGFYDIWVHKDELEKPYITLSYDLIKAYKIENISLSITHDDGFAIAVVVLESLKKQKKLFH